MASNRGVAYVEPGKVEVQSIDYPKLKMPASETNPFGGKDAPHGVILKIVTTNICGSDQHMVRGRTTAPHGLVLGHEITGEIIEKGSDVEMLEVGDLVTVPFNIACGRCRNCREGNTGICLTVNPARPGAAYGYVDMGGWVGGQAEYVMVPYADFNLIKFPNNDQAMAKIRDLTLLSDIFPTGYHGAVTAGVGPGSMVYVAGAGPVGLACAASCHLLGAAVVIVGDMITERLAQAKSFGCETIDLTQGRVAGRPDRSRSSVCRRWIPLSIASALKRTGMGGRPLWSKPATVLNSIMDVTRAGGAIGIPGLYVTDDPGGVTRTPKSARWAFASAWAGPSPTRSTRASARCSLQSPADASHLARQDSDRQGRQRTRDFARRRAAGLSRLR